MAVSTSFEDPHHSRSSDLCFDADAGMSQFISDQRGCLLFLEGEFRVGVDFSSYPDKVVFQLGRLIEKTNRGGELVAWSF
jgi:hypothetical protein